MSINIQSLQSKFSEFAEMIQNLEHKNIAPNIICLQELWQFPDSLALSLPGYHPIEFKLRRNNVQGGGVGIYCMLNQILILLFSMINPFL
jgi:hypothetical protein